MPPRAKRKPFPKLALNSSTHCMTRIAFAQPYQRGHIADDIIICHTCPNSRPCRPSRPTLRSLPTTDLLRILAKRAQPTDPAGQTDRPSLRLARPAAAKTVPSPGTGNHRIRRFRCSEQHKSKTKAKSRRPQGKVSSRRRSERKHRIGAWDFCESLCACDTAGLPASLLHHESTGSEGAKGTMHEDHTIKTMRSIAPKRTARH